MPRKLYGTDQNLDAGLAHMHRVGDPEFTTDSQNNDEYYEYDTDARTHNLESDR